MSSSRPARVTIKRLREDTYPEIYSVDPMPSGITDAQLTVEGLASSTGVVDTTAKTITFPVVAGIANGAVGDYDYEIVITAGGTTRTIVQGTWQILTRAVP